MHQPNTSSRPGSCLSFNGFAPPAKAMGLSRKLLIASGAALPNPRKPSVRIHLPVIALTSCKCSLWPWWSTSTSRRGRLAIRHSGTNLTWLQLLLLLSPQEQKDPCQRLGRERSPTSLPSHLNPRSLSAAPSHHPLPTYPCCHPAWNQHNNQAELTLPANAFCVRCLHCYCQVGCPTPLLQMKDLAGKLATGNFSREHRVATNIASEMENRAHRTTQDSLTSWGPARSLGRCDCQ